MTSFTCPSCGKQQETTSSVTIRVVDGDVCFFDSNGARADLCACGTTMTKDPLPEDKRGMPSFDSKKGGVVGRDWTGSASK